MKFKKLVETKTKIKDIFSELENEFALKDTYSDKFSKGFRKGIFLRVYSSFDGRIDRFTKEVPYKKVFETMDSLKNKIEKIFNQKLKYEEIKGKKNEDLFNRGVDFLTLCMYYGYENKSEKDIPTYKANLNIDGIDIEIYIFFNADIEKVGIRFNILDREKEIKSSSGDILPEFSEGKIVYDTWGYEQTNVDFYQIVKRSNNVVYIQKLKNNVLSYNSRTMSGYAVPDSSFENDKVERIVLRKDWKDLVFRNDGLKLNLRIWDGKKIDFSNYY